jgi:hypothetical protein
VERIDSGEIHLWLGYPDEITDSHLPGRPRPNVKEQDRKHSCSHAKHFPIANRPKENVRQHNRAAEQSLKMYALGYG